MGRISDLASCVCCVKLSRRDSSPAEKVALSSPASGTPGTKPGEQDASTTSGGVVQSHSSGPGTQLRGWDKAYNELQKNEPGLVADYEKLVAQRFSPNAAFSKPSSNIETSYSNRRVQMEKIAQTAMDEAEREFKTKSSLDEGMKIVELARSVGGSIVQGFPQAALPWAGVCCALQLFQNPLTENKAQRDGTIRVISRITWYCELDDQLSRKINTSGSSSGLLELLEKKIITLFEALLKFLMQSVCSCSKSRLRETLRDVLKLNQWEDSLEEIKRLDGEVLRDASYQGIADTGSKLHDLLRIAENNSQRWSEMNTLLERLGLEQQAKRQSRCMQALRLGDPEQQRKGIESSKGPRVEDLGEWILKTDQFSAWREADESGVLWIHGDPGKGKTMLLCGIIDSLEDSLLRPDALSYFFCQATDPRSNTFAAILRGIIFDLANKHPDLIQHVEDAYEHAGKHAFSEEGSWVNLTEILIKITDSLAPGITYIVIDALDECMTDREPLLRFIIEKALVQPKIKWILSSRNWADIRRQLEDQQRVQSLSLEDEGGQVSNAVQKFVEARVAKISEKQGYDEKLSADVKSTLLTNAQGTFLWVSLVCQRLYNTHPGRRWAEKKLKQSPPGLDQLYGNMMEGLIKHEDGELCLKILACVTLVYRPITLQELSVIADLPDDLASNANTDEENIEAVAPLVHICCSFLTLQNDTVYFVHQSAKDYLLNSEQTRLFPSGVSGVHRSMFHRSLGRLLDSEALHRDIYNMEAHMALEAYGTDVRAVKKPDPDPLIPISYHCIYWIDHLVCSMQDNELLKHDLRDGGSVHNFLETKFLYWLEALSLLESIPEGFISFSNLLQATRDMHPGDCLQISCLLDFIKDARQFFLFHRDAIEQFPLQAYTSALVFSPTRSLVRQKFAEDMPPWIYIHSGVGEQWHDCSLRIKPAKGQSLLKMALSQDGKWIATLEDDEMIRLWDRASGRCTGCSVADRHYDSLSVMAFSNDSQQIAVTSFGETHLLEVATLNCILKFDIGSHFLPQWVRFSCDDKQVIVAWRHGLCSWDMTTKSLQEMSPSGDGVMDLKLTGELYISMARGGNRDITIRDTTTGNVVSARCVWPENDRDDESYSPKREVFFSPDGRFVARCTSFISIWDTTTDAIIQTIDGYAETLCFSYDNKFIAWSPSQSHKIKVVRVATGELVREFLFFDGSSAVEFLMFFQDGRQLVSFQRDSIRILDTWNFSEQQHTVMRHPSSAFVLVSPDEDLVFWSIHEVAKMLNLKSNKESDLVTDAGGEMRDIHFTPDWQIMSLRNAEKVVRVFEVKTCRCIRTIPQPAEQHCLSHDGQLVGTIHLGPDSVYVVTVWSVSSGVMLHTFTTLTKKIRGELRASFSLNGIYLAFFGRTHFHAWDIAAGNPTYSLEHDWEEMDFDLFHHRDDVIISSKLSDPTIQSLNGNQHERRIRLPLEGECPMATRISKDDKLLVMYFDDSSQIWIWDMASNACRQKIDGRGYWLPYGPYPTFHESNLGLTTSAGDVVIDPDTNSGISVEDIQLSGASLLGKGPWIAWKGQNILMKPAEYEVTYSTGASCKGRTVAFGSDSGELVVLRLDL